MKMTLVDLVQQPNTIAWATGLAWFAYIVFGVIYRLYLSPIAKFPGPKLAAVTLWYEFYYDVVCRGQYVFKIAEMHKQYGPIIRISPYELHVETPQFYEELFAGGGQKRDKYEWSAKAFATHNSVLSTVDHNTHRMRRSAMNPFFSKASVRRLQPVIDERIDKLISRIKGFQNSGKPLTISVAYVAFSSDVVAEYSFGNSYHHLEKEDFDAEYAQCLHEAAGVYHFNKHIFWPFQLILSLPFWLTTILVPALSTYVAFINDCERQIKAIKCGQKDKFSEKANPTIFHELLEGDLPASEKSVERLVQEGNVLIGAGTETTAWCLSVITYHLLSQPPLLKKLRDELRAAIPDPNQLVRLETLESLPYLKACIQEGLRLGYGNSSRLQRSCPDKDIVFNDGEKDWYIPPGTPTSMDVYNVHHLETIFPDSHTYNPQRFLDDPRLEKYMVAFSRGSRACIGINLAQAELFSCVSRVFRVFGGVGNPGEQGTLELFETTEGDVRMARDMFIPTMMDGTKGVRVMVKE